jgi:hypothetical protein
VCVCVCESIFLCVHAFDIYSTCMYADTLSLSQKTHTGEFACTHTEWNRNTYTHKHTACRLERMRSICMVVGFRVQDLGCSGFRVLSLGAHCG